MRVLHCLWRGEIGGAERALFQLIDAQLEDGSSRPGALFGRGGGPYVERLRGLGVPVLELGLRSGADPSALVQARRAMLGWDVHHFHSMEPGLITASLLAPGPLRVYTNRGGTAREDWTPRQRLRHRIGGRLLRRFDALSANTRHAAIVAARRYGLPPERFEVTPNGLDPSLLVARRPRDEVRDAVGAGPEDLIVGTTAVLRPLKRIEYLIDALAEVDPGIPVLGVVVGDGPDRERLEARAGRLGLEDRVRFIGALEDVADHVAAMDLFVLSSGTRESFGNALVEAMALGVPSVVFADSPGPAEHVRDGETGWIVGDVGGLAERIAEVAGDRASARAVGRRAAEHVRRIYSIPAMVARYRDLYEEARARRSARRRKRSRWPGHG